MIEECFRYLYRKQILDVVTSLDLSRVWGCHTKIIKTVINNDRLQEHTIASTFAMVHCINSFNLVNSEDGEP